MASWNVKAIIVSLKYFDSTENNLYQFSTNYIDSQQFFGLGFKINHEFVTDKFGANLGITSANNIDNLPLSPAINCGIYYKI